MKNKVISLLVVALLFTTLVSCEKMLDGNEGKNFVNEALGQNKELVYGTIEPDTEEHYTELVSCGKTDDNNGKIFANELLEQNQEPVYGIIEPGTEEQYTDIWLEYTDEERLYFKLIDNVSAAVPVIAKALSDKGWDNIECKNGFPDEYFNWGIYITPEEENAPVMCVVEGNMDNSYIIIPVIFTSKYPKGKVSRVIYAGSRHCVESENMEILDPFRPETWEQDFTY